MDMNSFRRDARRFIEENCPPAMRGEPVHFEDTETFYATPEARAWRDAMATRGWTAPAWPADYGGGGLSPLQEKVLAEEMAAVKALPPEFGMGIWMIGPTLLEFGTEEQKRRHIPKIVSGEIRWCQGYSEPGAGSDLASLRTSAVLDCDHFIINGQKIWTSGAQHADWMFALVRTDTEAAKHDGISFVLLDMHQSGVTIRPIQLISGSSPFCETFFDNARARREDLVGELNHGWAVGKRLLQFERSASSSLSGNPNTVELYVDIAKKYVGDSAGRVSDETLRHKITRQVMLERALGLTIQRVTEESKGGGAPGAATSIFKLVGARAMQNSSSLQSELRGIAGVAWEAEGFTAEEVDSMRGWLRDRAVSIYGGTDEVQMNIIAKRVLGLPD